MKTEMEKLMNPTKQKKKVKKANIVLRGIELMIYIVRKKKLKRRGFKNLEDDKWGFCDIVCQSIHNKCGIS